MKAKSGLEGKGSSLLPGRRHGFCSARGFQHGVSDGDVSTGYKLKRPFAPRPVDGKVSPVQRENRLDILSMREIYQHRVRKLGPQAFILLHDGLDRFRLPVRNDRYFQDP